MIILVDNLPWYISLISKIAACVLIILIAFKFYRVKSFAVALGIFLFSNFLFLGIIVGIYLLSGNHMIAVNNSTVYLNIGAKALLFSAAAAYVVASLVVRIYNKSVSKGDIVTFTGGGVYKSSTAEYASVQKNVTSTCKVTAVNTKGTHPYHCISQDGKGVYGWVNAADVK